MNLKKLIETWDHAIVRLGALEKLVKDREQMIADKIQVTYPGKTYLQLEKLQYKAFMKDAQLVGWYKEKSQLESVLNPIIHTGSIVTIRGISMWSLLIAKALQQSLVEALGE
jgi:hypothetical protein